MNRKLSMIIFYVDIALMLIFAFGLVMLFSASYYYAQNAKGDGLHYVKRQLIYFGVGMVLLLLLSHLKYTFYQKFAIVAYLLLIALLVYTWVNGVEHNGAKRWISIGSVFELQPSEIAKFVMVMVAASFMTRNKNRMSSFLKGILPMLLYMLIPCFLIYKQPNLSMVIIVAVTTLIMIFLGGAKTWHLAAMAVVGFALILLLANAEKYRSSRLDIWLHPWSKASTDGYQTVQSLYALGNGGMFGQGLNYSRQKLLFIIL